MLSFSFSWTFSSPAHPCVRGRRRLPSGLPPLERPWGKTVAGPSRPRALAARSRSAQVQRWANGCAPACLPRAARVWVAYLLSAGNISTPLPSRLGGPHQLVIHLRNGLSRPHAPCCPDRKHTYHALHHGHPIRLPLTPHNVVATVARDKAALLAASTHGRSIRPPSLAYTAATAWPGPGH